MQKIAKKNTIKKIIAQYKKIKKASRDSWNKVQNPRIYKREKTFLLYPRARILFYVQAYNAYFIKINFNIKLVKNYCNGGDSLLY